MNALNNVYTDSNRWESHPNNINLIMSITRFRKISRVQQMSQSKDDILCTNHVLHWLNKSGSMS